ncbi:MAG: AAA family ATPase [Anaerolineae bacterium]|nr:AAA family ATPase [Anaerolineae bacterium]
MLSFGEWVQQRRGALGLTRPDLARNVGCAPVTIKKIERDERRPSQQIAALLAEHLLIPDADRDAFMRMARGEFVAAPISSRDLVSLPAFLRAGERAKERDETPFVTREAELGQLDAHLDAAFAGKGRVVFITGEAGNGKTRLAQEFVRRAQANHAQLVVAHGNCSAHTGIGDPYLPFREILALLAGDVEARWAAGTVSASYAQRLWHLVPQTIEALLDAGPDLVDIFMPGPALVTRAEAAAPRAADLLARLKGLVARHESRQSQAHLQQGALFSQYTRVLQTLARQNPLLLVIDDLQWADAGSISLLFHLGRHLEGHRILVAGLYRPSDIGLGRDGERHPLEPAVNELQRLSGNIHIVLSEADGRAFVEALVDTEPNRLDQAFCDALYAQTGGHPLFTVEMLRGLQARGDLVQDEAGRWTKGGVLDWKKLPARIEGVIQERIGRLPADAREMLKVASVEGEVFKAEVVARVQGLDEREVLGSLGETLDRQHRLVKVWENQQIGTKQVTHYRFRHILFQQYLDDNLHAAERVYYHRAVGNELEALYGERADRIAPDLARHFAIAGDEGRALDYFIQAGDRAMAAQANVEAAAHYSQGVAIARQREMSTEQRAHLYIRLGRALELNSEFERALTIYKEMEGEAGQRGDEHLALAALMAQVTLYATFTPVYDPERAETLAQEALALARRLGDEAAEAKILWALLFVYLITNRREQAVASGERSLALARRLDLREQMAYTLNDLGSHCYLVGGPLEKAVAALREASELWRELDNRPMLANSLAGAALVHMYAGKFSESLAFSDEALAMSRAIDNVWGQSYSRFRTGYIYWERGEPDQAIAVMEACIDAGERSGFTASQVAARADLADVYGHLGAMERGMAVAQRALEIAETKAPPFRLYALAVLAQLYLWQDGLTEAAAVIAEGEQNPFAAGWPLHYLPVRLAAAELALRRGECERARALSAGLRADIQRSGAAMYMPKTLSIQGQALLGLERQEGARACLEEAATAAKAMGARASLWPILFALSQAVDDQGAAQMLRQQAGEIVTTIAGRAPSPELRQSFIHRADIRLVLESVLES